MTAIARTTVLRAAQLFAGAAAALFLVHGAARAQATPDAPAATQNSVKLVRVVVDMPVDTVVVSIKRNRFCMSPLVQTWHGGRVEKDPKIYFTPFRRELERAGYKVVTPGEGNLFSEEPDAADYEVAAVITDEHIEGCGAVGNVFTGEEELFEGESSMKMDWQLYSPLRKRVVAHVSTSGNASLDQKTAHGGRQLLSQSFSENVRALAANADFRAALSQPRALAKGILLPAKQNTIGLAGSLKAGPSRIDNAVGSIVTLTTGSGSGSGILVSRDGYILTNAHVVGDETAVRARWSDGIETVAQVVRVARDRDIALVKTNPRERTPLAIKRGAVTPGQRVYAIGSPKGKVFQGTVSSGVVSATRILDGLRYIQSDVAVSPGSSGGALLDETGSVIGVTVSGVENRGPAGLNLFIPIGDAMDFLSLEQQ